MTRVFNSFGKLSLAILLLAAVLSPLQGRTRKADRYLRAGQEEEFRNQYEKALLLYERALADDPKDPAYQMAVRRARFQAAMARVHSGQKLRAQGKLEEALEEFLRALVIDPGSSIAEQEAMRTREMLEREKTRGAPAKPEERGLTPAEQAQRAAEERASRLLPLPELKPINRQISTLKMANQPPRVLFETVGKLAGINVVFDPEYQPPPGRQNYTIDLNNVTLEEALDYLAVLTKSFWKPLSANTIFVTNENPTKRRDYEDHVVKVFYLKNPTTVQELQEIFTAVRTVVDIRRAFTYNSQNAILVRGTADQVAMAEKLFHDLDKPKAEVVIDVVVMEANRARTRDLAASVLTGGNPGVNLPVTYTGGDKGAITLNRIKDIGSGDYSITVPTAIFRAVISDSRTRILQRPQVRAVENQKAELKIGDKVPYATGSFQPGPIVGGIGITPLTQFNFYDTGVNVSITPKAHGRDEVSLHVEVELSNVSGRVDLGGLSQPIISVKRVVHDIRLKEGEVSLLGGLMQLQNTRSINGIPLLSEIPVVGRLFGPEHLEQNQGELLIALIPHIVRAPDYTELNTRGVASGSQDILKLNYAPREAPAAATAPPASTPAETPPAPAPEPTKPQTPKPEPVKPAPRAYFNPNSVRAPLSSAVSLTLQVDNVVDLFSAPVRLHFDPKILRVVGVQPGALLSADGQKVTFSENTQNDVGEVAIIQNRVPGAGGISGSGALLTITFQAVGRGESTVAVTELGLKDSQLRPINTPPPAANITVQ